MKVEGEAPVSGDGAGCSSTSSSAVIPTVTKEEPQALPTADATVKPVAVNPSDEAKPGAYGTRGVKVRYNDMEGDEASSPSGNPKKKRKTTNKLVNENVVRDNGIYKPKKRIRRKNDPNRCQVTCLLPTLN